jgi:hypothetical protein
VVSEAERIKGLREESENVIPGVTVWESERLGDKRKLYHSNHRFNLWVQGCF